MPNDQCPMSEPATQSPILTPRLKVVWALACSCARKAGNCYVGTEHLLAALVSAKGGPGHVILAALLGVDLEEARKRVLAEVAKVTGATHWMGFHTELREFARVEAELLAAKADRLALRMDAACAAEGGAR